MRVLVTTQPASGHFHPLVPLAVALRAAGHDVRFACSPSFCPTVEAVGFTALPAGLDWLEADLVQTFPELRRLTGEPRRLWPLPNVFAGITAERMVPDLIALARDWRPQLIVRSSKEYGGCIAAEALDVPHATVQTDGFAYNADQVERTEARLNRLRRTVGLPPDPDLNMLFRPLTLATEPPTFQRPDVPLPPTARRMRVGLFDRSGDEALPSWADALPNQPTVYATLGTVTNRRLDIFAAIIEGQAGMPLNLILTIGRNQDPADFPARSPHVYIERYIPQSLLLPRCDLVILHGGFNSVLGALCEGLPMVIVPFGGDQPQNASRCAELGAARVIDLAKVSPLAIGDAVRDVLDDPAYRRNAHRVRREIESLPSPEQAVTWLEQLVYPQP